MRNGYMRVLSFTHPKWVKVVVNAFVLVAMVLGLSMSPFVTDTAQAAGRWCSVTPSRIFQKGWQRFPHDPNYVLTWNGRSLHAQANTSVYTYFNGEWMGLSYHGYMNDEFGRYNQWGIPTWMPGRYPRTWNNVNNWRINFWSADGGCR